MKTETRHMLPTDINPDDRAELENAGVTFLEKADPWLDQTYVELPEGWLICMSNHGAWSRDLLDKDGRVRASTGLRPDGKSFLFISRT